MLYVNDELVKPGSPAHEKFTKFKREVLSQFKNPVVFKSGRPIKFNETGLPEPVPVEWIPLDHNIMGEDGGEHWRYCDRPPRKRADGNFSYSPRGKLMKKDWRFDKTKDAEQIFFFHQISPFIEKGSIVFEDKERTARETLEKETFDLDVRWMITSDHSPISEKETGAETTLRMMAAAWGVADAQTDKLSIAEIKLALLSAVQHSQQNYVATRRGYKEFLEEVEQQDKVYSMSNTQKAIDAGIIEYDKNSFSWKFTSSGTPLVTIPARDAADPKAALNKFLSLNEKSAKILELAIGGAYVSDSDQPDDIDPDENGMTAEKVKGMKYYELKAAAAELNISASGKRDVLEQRVLNAL